MKHMKWREKNMPKNSNGNRQKYQQSHATSVVKLSARAFSI